MQITVKKIDATTFEVTVDGRTTTKHTVTLDAAYHQKLASGIPAESLIERSFEFLLEREPNTSILRRFDLPVIQSYFPEYEKTIRGMTS